MHKRRGAKCGTHSHRPTACPLVIFNSIHPIHLLLARLLSAASSHQKGQTNLSKVHRLIISSLRRRGLYHPSSRILSSRTKLHRSRLHQKRKVWALVIHCSRQSLRFVKTRCHIAPIHRRSIVTFIVAVVITKLGGMNTRKKREPHYVEG